MSLASILGLSLPEGEAQHRAHAKDFANMREELRKKSTDAFYQTAYKHAAADVLDEMVQELRAEKVGTLEKRVMTDPENSELRNEVFAQAAAKHVERISGGRISMSRASMDRIVQAKTFK